MAIDLRGVALATVLYFIVPWMAWPATASAAPAVAPSQIFVTPQPPTTLTATATPRVDVSRLRAIIKARTDVFVDKGTTDLVPNMYNTLHDFFHRCQGRVDGFLDWQYSYMAKLRGLYNFTCYYANKAANGMRWVIGWDQQPTVDYNEVLCREKFETLVISEASVKACLRDAGNCFDGDCHRLLRDLIRQLNLDMSQFLSQVVGIHIDESEVEIHFRQALDRMNLAGNLKVTMGSPLLEILASHYAGSAAGTYSALAMGNWLSSSWYASLSTTGKIAAYLGLTTAPPTILPGLVDGLAGTGVGILAAMAVDWAVEKLTRPGAHARIIESLTGLERGIWFGEGATEGLESLMKRNIYELATKFEEAYTQAIRDVLAARGVIV